jgi:hypothetical protein
MIVCWQTQQIQKAAPGDTASEGVEVRYARAQLQLAETNLKRLEQSNKRMPRSVPSSVVADYQHDVQVAKTRLEQAVAGQVASDFHVLARPARFIQSTLNVFGCALKSPSCNLSAARC